MTPRPDRQATGWPRTVPDISPARKDVVAPPPNTYEASCFNPFDRPPFIRQERLEQLGHSEFGAVPSFVRPTHSTGTAPPPDLPRFVPLSAAFCTVVPFGLPQCGPAGRETQLRNLKTGGRETHKVIAAATETP